MQSVLLVLVGGALLRLSLSGAYQDYVKPGLGPYLTLSGAILAGLGVWGAVRAGFGPAEPAGEVDPADSGDEVEHGDAHGSGHDHPGARTAWLLLLPVLTIFVIAPPPLGAFAADRSVSSIPPPADSAAALPVLPKPDPVDIGVVDYALRAVWDDGKTLAGRTVRMVGFVTAAPGGGWYLTKMQISCCAADAQPFRIRTVGAPPFAPDTWVQVVGSWVPGGGTQRDDAIPNVKVDSAVRVPRPANPYE